jgi:hypothetical protein
MFSSLTPLDASLHQLEEDLDPVPLVLDLRIAHRCGSTQF